MMPRVEIVNIVATVKLEPMPDPGEVLEKIPGSKPVKRFRGAMIRIGKTPVLFYKKKIIVTGTKSLEELEDVIKKLVGILHRHGIIVQSKGYEVVNVTARVELGQRIDLVEASAKLGGIYDPDYRPYLVAKVNNTVIMLTHNGKLVVLGAKSIMGVHETITLIKKLIV